MPSVVLPVGGLPWDALPDSVSLRRRPLSLCRFCEPLESPTLLSPSASLSLTVARQRPVPLGVVPLVAALLTLLLRSLPRAHARGALACCPRAGLFSIAPSLVESRSLPYLKANWRGAPTPRPLPRCSGPPPQPVEVSSFSYCWPPGHRDLYARGSMASAKFTVSNYIRLHEANSHGILYVV